MESIVVERRIPNAIIHVDSVWFMLSTTNTTDSPATLNTKQAELPETKTYIAMIGSIPIESGPPLAELAGAILFTTTL